MTHKGSCHCGSIAYEVEGDFGEVMECNCSICSRKGYLHWFVPRDKLRVAKGEAGLAAYTFNKRAIEHKFCPRCGCAVFGLGKDPQGNMTAAVNVRCLEGVDLSKVKVKPFDGRSL